MVVLPLITAFARVRTFVVVPADALSVWRMLALGVVVGTPMSLPVVMTTRKAALRHLEALERWRVAPAEHPDRINFAEDLADMIQELAPDRSAVTAEAIGDEYRVLHLIGDLESRNGELLTAALRDELDAVGFTHVEGTHASREWWMHV